MAIALEVWGDWALFSRPEMKVEHVSYEMMTPSAARGILEAIFWHPGMKYRIDRIRVCKPIQFSNLRRNEVKATVSARQAKTVMERGAGALYLVTSEEIQQRASMLLRDVHYVIEAHFDIEGPVAPGDNPAKFQEMLTRRARKGQYYCKPYFGCREFPVNFRLCEEIPPCPDELKGVRNLGWMLYDMDYSDPENITPRFFRGILRDGVMEVPEWDSEEVRG